MRMLICGAGKTARELLKLLGDSWRVTVADKSQEVLDRIPGLFPNIEALHQEDVSSPLVLDDIGIEDFDYVLAMTGSDEANLVVTRHAADKSEGHVLALVHESENKERFSELEVRTIMASNVVAQSVYYYLQDPRLRVMPLHSGPATVMEFRAADHFKVVGKRAEDLSDDSRRLVAVYREGELVFPDPDFEVRPEDRLLMIGTTGTFSEVCELLECQETHFPLIYGHGLLVALPEVESEAEAASFLDESLYVAQNTQIRHVELFCSRENHETAKRHLKQWPHEVEAVAEAGSRDMLERVRRSVNDKGFGLVILPGPDQGLLAQIFGSSLTSLAKELERPVLLARRSMPYERILCPFNGQPASRAALELAADLAKQLSAELTAVIVESPGIISGESDSDWSERVLAQVGEIAHIQKVRIKEAVLEGNPVSEVQRLSEHADLVVIGASRKGKGLISPNVAEHLARKTRCSALLLP